MQTSEQRLTAPLPPREEMFAALAARDATAIEYIMHYGHGPELAPMLRAAASTLSGSDQALVLLAAMDSAPAENAALAIALLAPGLHGIPQVTDSLFDTLLPHPARRPAACQTGCR